MTETNNTEMALEISNATVYLGGKEILHDLSWQVKRGERCFILGANGAGKTTLVKTMMGYAWPKFGAEIKVLGNKFGETNLVELRKRIAWVSPFMQQWTSNDSTGLQMVLSGFDGTLGLFRKPTDEEIVKAREIMKRLACSHLEEQAIFTMSSGEQVKILIARALLTKPELMILDEPSVYLDIAGREFLLHEIEHIAETHPDLTIIFITQRIEDILPVFDNGVILANGKIDCQGLREDILDEDNLSRAFDMKIRLMKNRSGRLWSMLED